MVKIYNLRVIKDKRQDLRNNMSVPEKILWKWIRNEQLGFKFRRQHGIGKYVTDFFCPALKLDVEVDGQVHGEKIIASKDKHRDDFMKSIGIKVKRYTAKEINDNVEWVLDEIKKCCDELASGKQKTANPT